MSDATELVFGGVHSVSITENSAATKRADSNHGDSVQALSKRDIRERLVPLSDEDVALDELLRAVPDRPSEEDAEKQRELPAEEGEQLERMQLYVAALRKAVKREGHQRKERQRRRSVVESWLKDRFDEEKKDQDT